ncbi:MAG TPA: hypothetical protein G4N95_01940 [Anaerolineae bacterium]|nr:hypothetical protein [Anaerolineae bacterium]
MIFLLPFGISFLINIVFMPLFIKLSPRIGLVAKPRIDRWHSSPTPKIGGILIFLGFLLSLGISFFFISANKIDWGLLLGATIVFFLGLYDDFKQISPSTKIIGQIFAASLVVIFGRSIGFFPWESVNIVVTFIWLVGITNAINLLDNMDGLAGGIAFIAAGLLSYLFWQINQTELLVLSLAIAGSILGFLFYNFPPAKIFMGDSGSLFLGFTLASLSIARVPRASNILAVLGVPILLFLLPILDTTLVAITRILRGQSPVQGGRDHTSHRLIAFGLNERQAVIILYGVAFFSGILGTTLESIDYSVSLVLLPIILVAFTLFTAYLGRIKMVDSNSITNKGVMTRLMIELTTKGRILEIALDFLIISITYYLAVWTQSGLSLNQITMNFFLKSLPIALASAYLSFFLFGIYKDVWQYVGIRDLIRYAVASVGAIIINGIILLIMNYSFQEIVSIHLLFMVFLFLALAVSRSSFRIFDQIYLPQSHHIKDVENILIYGADDAGEFTLRWLLNNPQHGLVPRGFIDNDPFKRGRKIHGIHVIGDIENLRDIILSQKVDGIILTSDDTVNRKIRQICDETGIWLKRMNITFEPIEQSLRQQL